MVVELKEMHCQRESVVDVFFQAEDGIRDYDVTGVQTCALPICYTPIELADGFLQIANANMTRAIRRISVAKGYDPADYALVTFGGAGAQHACAIAEAIGIKTILVHPFAGILSAYGIGLADVRRFGQQSVLKPFSTETLQEIEPLFEELEATALAEVQAEGIADENIGQPQRSLDMRYQGVDRKSAVSGKSLDLGGRPILNKKLNTV